MLSGVSLRTSFRNGNRISSGQNRFNVSGAKRPLELMLGRPLDGGTEGLARCRDLTRSLKKKPGMRQLKC